MVTTISMSSAQLWLAPASVDARGFARSGADTTGVTRAGVVATAGSRYLMADLCAAGTELRGEISVLGRGVRRRGTAVAAAPVAKLSQGHLGAERGASQISADQPFMRAAANGEAQGPLTWRPPVLT
ncbi:hypothetical protein [Bailinhaonella thermotolerans]|uniref:Uncharacterized protein n=1 Tax=Bailinhaonella thermotolerans TaxID=1070861 RepID=A0A3A4B647_9ACTN|nr:hypothetical protein [Bailinhaonella thermotolerans]RJL33511.1 hypothetical protein D5H75_12125 [Bailinhaonella thermotolerans]